MTTKEVIVCIKIYLGRNKYKYEHIISNNKCLYVQFCFIEMWYSGVARGF